MVKKENSITKLLNDNKKRHLLTLAFITPFIIIIGIFGFKVFKQAKDLLGLAGSTEATIKDNSYSIDSGSFVLRENATDIQKEYFAELKDIYENSNGEATDADKAISTVKNFVADFYTWSNKQGQYDVGGTYYWYAPQRSTIYIQARDQFYKYINEYINEYGADALLEVENVEASTNGKQFAFVIEENEFGAFIVNANWTYVVKENNFKTSSYDTSASFVVIDNNGRFEIAYMGNKEYEANEQE